VFASSGRRETCDRLRAGRPHRGGRGRPVTGRTAARLAWGLAAFALAATTIELWLLFISPDGLPLNHPERSAAIDYLEFFLFVIVGALVAWKRPSNRVGWLLLAYVVLRSVGGVMAAYGERGVLVEPLDGDG
jgi:hypothetical protein